MQNRARVILTVLDHVDPLNRLDALGCFENHITEVFTGENIAELLSRFTGDEQIKIILKLDKNFLKLIQKGDHLASVLSVIPYPNQATFINLLILHTPVIFQNKEEIRQVLDVLSYTLHATFLRWANGRIEELSTHEHEESVLKDKEIKNIPETRAASPQRSNSCFAFWQRCYRPAIGCAPRNEPKLKAANHGLHPK